MVLKNLTVKEKQVLDLQINDSFNLDLEIILEKNSTLNLTCPENFKPRSAFNWTANLESYASLNLYFWLQIQQDFNFDLVINLKQKASKLNIFSIFEIQNANLRYKCLVNHLASQSVSQTEVKTILKKEAKADLHTEITVAKKASQTEISLQNQNLLLDQSATLKTLPIFNFYNQPTKARHGVSTSFLEKKQELFLNSRGLAKRQIQEIQQDSFTFDLLAKFPKYVKT